MLALAKPEDVEILLPMCRNFCLASPYKAMDDDKVRQGLLDIIEHRTKGVVVLGLADDVVKGFIIGLKTELPFSRDTIATELAWWVEPDARGRLGLELLNAYEYWAKEVAKCTMVQLSNLSDPKLDRLYTRRGFTLSEHSYVKGLI